MRFWMLAGTVIVLALLTWGLGMGLFLHSVIHGPTDDDPVRQAELVEHSILIGQLLMAAFLSSLVLSSWLAGLIAKKSRIVAGVILAIHGAAIVFVSIVM